MWSICSKKPLESPKEADSAGLWWRGRFLRNPCTSLRLLDDSVNVRYRYDWILVATGKEACSGWASPMDHAGCSDHIQQGGTVNLCEWSTDTVNSTVIPMVAIMFKGKSWHQKVIKRHLVRHLFLQELDPCVAHNELFVEMEIGPSFSLWRSLREIVLFAKMQIIQICWRLLEVTAIARKETLLNNETVMSLTIAWVMVEEAWNSFFLSFFLFF